MNYFSTQNSRDELVSWDRFKAILIWKNFKSQLQTVISFQSSHFVKTTFLLKNWFIERIRMKNNFVWLFLNREDSSIQLAVVTKNAIKYLIVWYFAKFEERNKNSLAVTDIKLIIYSIARQLTTQKGWEREKKSLIRKTKEKNGMFLL